MSFKEDFLTAIHHGIPKSVPVFARPARFNIGFMDEFEKGPAGGGYDGYGALWVMSPEGPVPSTSKITLKDITKWREQIQFPDLSAINWDEKAKKDMAGFDPETQLLEYCMGNGPFERMLAWMGYEELIYAFEDEPDACHELLNAWKEHRIHFIELVCKYYKPDFITIYDDVAFERGLFLSLDTYREFIKPIHIAVNNAIRENGALPINHCCGKAETLIEDFIEEGAVAWVSCQPVNDIAGLLEKYHDQICISGGFNSNGTPGSVNATEDMRRAEVRRAIDAYSKWGSYIFGNQVFLSTDPKIRAAWTEQTNDEAFKYGKNYYIRNKLC